MLESHSHGGCSGSGGEHRRHHIGHHVGHHSHWGESHHRRHGGEVSSLELRLESLLHTSLIRGFDKLGVRFSGEKVGNIRGSVEKVDEFLVFVGSLFGVIFHEIEFVLFF